jgi:arginyl-tRNA synthetase
MSSTVNSAAPSVTVVNGMFQVKDSDGSTRSLSFASLMIDMGVRALTANQQAFETQLAQAQSLVDCMQELNAIMQAANSIKGQGDSDTKYYGDPGRKEDSLASRLDAFNKKYPSFNVSYTTYDGNSTIYTKQQLETLISNLQTTQSLVSSFNEQQGTRTSQAMSRSSGFLQQLQTAMQTAKEALAAAAKAGSY